MVMNIDETQEVWGVKLPRGGSRGRRSPKGNFYGFDLRLDRSQLEVPRPQTKIRSKTNHLALEVRHSGPRAADVWNREVISSCVGRSFRGRCPNRALPPDTPNEGPWWPRSRAPKLRKWPKTGRFNQESAPTIIAMMFETTSSDCQAFDWHRDGPAFLGERGSGPSPAPGYS